MNQKSLRQAYAAAQRRRREPAAQFEQFTASELYCPKCKIATRVKERLLLVLPEGKELYDYRCTTCGESLGKKTG